MAFRREGNQGAWGALGRACLAGSRSPEYLEQREQRKVAGDEMREQGRLAGEESGLVVHFKDFDFSSCGLGRILREEEHDLIYAVMKFSILKGS